MALPFSVYEDFRWRATGYHGIGQRSRKGVTLAPCPWITQGESEGLFVFKRGYKKKRQPTGEVDCLSGEESF
jgi:hypothetical protein